MFFWHSLITKYENTILLQSVTTSCYYKVPQVLQCVTVITKWDVSLIKIDTCK